jgi:hypothetical protein
VSGPFGDPIIKSKKVSTHLCHFRIAQEAGSLPEPIPVRWKLHPRKSILLTKTDDHSIGATFRSTRNEEDRFVVQSNGIPNGFAKEVVVVIPTTACDNHPDGVVEDYFVIGRLC